MKKVGSIFYLIFGLLGIGCWGFNTVRAFEMENVFMIGAFGFLTLLSVMLCGWAVKDFQELKKKIKVS